MMSQPCSRMFIVSNFTSSVTINPSSAKTNLYLYTLTLRPVVGWVISADRSEPQ